MSIQRKDDKDQAELSRPYYRAALTITRIDAEDMNGNATQQQVLMEGKQSDHSLINANKILVAAGHKKIVEAETPV